MKIIVTHLNPDLDAICSCWLIKKFLPGWNEARVEFVSQGETFNNQPVDSNPNVLHVDTGLGMLDHHQTDEYTSAAKKTWEFIKGQKNKQNVIPNSFRDLSKNEKMLKQVQHDKKGNIGDEAVERIVKIVNEIDHFGEVYWPEAENDRYEFFLDRIFDGWELKYPNESRRLMEWGFDCLDGLYAVMVSKVKAEEELKRGIKFKTKWGEGIALETINDEVIKLGQRKGFKIVVRKDPRKGYVRIKSIPSREIDLTAVYQKLKELDPDATWFLHASKNMLLNGSTHNPKMKPTKLSLEEVIEVIQKVIK